MRKTGEKTPKRSSGVDPRFVAVLATFSEDALVSRRRLFSSENALTVNGKIFAMLAKGGFTVKLPRQRATELVSAGSAEYFDPGHGRLMKEWITVTAQRVSWVALATEAYRFVRDGKQ